MTVLDVCEPLFQRVCELNRLARTGRPTPDYPSLRREMTALLDRVRIGMLSDPGLERHWSKLEMPLFFFVDSMISESPMPAASQWNQNRLAYERRELAGDEKFFDLLDEHLRDGGSDATARLGVFYTCIGLGFCGWHQGRPEHLRSLMIEMRRRIDPAVLADRHGRICPDAYEHTDTRDLIERPPIPIPALVAILVGLFLVFVTIDLLLYIESTLPLRQDLAEIISNGLGQTLRGFRLMQ